MSLDEEAMCNVVQRYLDEQMHYPPRVLGIEHYPSAPFPFRVRLADKPATTLADVAGEEVRCVKCGDVFSEHATDACGAFVARAVQP